VPFLVMELVDGPSLASVLAAGPLDPAQTIGVIAQVAASLHAAHIAGIVHRDVKPANLLVGRDGQVKITDFGIASVNRDASLTATGILVGTAAYLAPERVSGGSATPASDLYSLGVVGHECLTGTPPFRGPALEVAEAHLRRPFPPLPVGTSPEVRALVADLTAKEPGKRPRSAREVSERAARMRAAGKTTLLNTPFPAPAPDGRPAALVLTKTDVTGLTLPRSSQLAVGQRRVARRPQVLWRRIGVSLALSTALVAAGLGGWHAGLTGAARPRSAAAPRPRTPPPAPKVMVSSASLVGRRVRPVVAELRGLGLRPRLVWMPTSARAPGTVVSVQPGGALPPGTIVTVMAAAQPAPQGGQDSGDERGGNGSNDGGERSDGNAGGDGGGNSD
jgi:serine/threonine-protein kinase